MNYKERVLYNGLLFEQIKSLLNTTEIITYDNSMILKDVFGNCLKIEIAHFKNEKGYEDYKTTKKLEEEKRIEKDKERNKKL